MANNSSSGRGWILACAFGVMTTAFLLAGCVVQHSKNDSGALGVDMAFHPIDGEWTLKSIVGDGKHSPAEMKKLQKWSIHNNKIDIADGEGGTAEAIITFPDRNSNAIDIHITYLRSPPLILYGLYEETNKSLRICYSLSKKYRPNDMRDPVPEESGNVLYTFTK
jgi:hypothetical protein